MSVSEQTTQILIITCVARDSAFSLNLLNQTPVRFHVYILSRVEGERWLKLI